MGNLSENWDDYEKVYKPIYQNMMHQLKHGKSVFVLTIEVHSMN